MQQQEILPKIPLRHTGPTIQHKLDPLEDLQEGPMEGLLLEGPLLEHLLEGLLVEGQQEGPQEGLLVEGPSEQQLPHLDPAAKRTTSATSSVFQTDGNISNKTSQELYCQLKQKLRINEKTHYVVLVEWCCNKIEFRTVRLPHILNNVC